MDGSDIRRTIALIPIGKVETSLLNTIGQAVAEAFGRAWFAGPRLPHPAYAYHKRRGQYQSDPILSQLRRIKLPAEKVLGLVDLDLFTPGLNFVFGQATLNGREAIVALPRLRPGFYGQPHDEGLFRQRAIKEAVHELGHTYGLSHCYDRRCVMHFSNSLRDTDEKGSTFCAVCQAKLGR